MEDRERSKLGEVERIGENLKSDGIKKIFFDMDSTLVKTAEGFQESIWEFSGWIAEEGGLEMEEVNERYMETIVGLRGEFSVRPEISGATMEIVRRWCGVEESERYDEEVGKMMELYMDSFEECEGASEIVDLVFKTGVWMGVITLAGEEWTRRKIRKHFFGKFEDFYCVDPAGLKDTKAWKKGMNELNVLPENAMVIGDSWKSDIVPALELGVKKIVWINRKGEDHKDERVIEIGGIGELKEILLSGATPGTRTQDLLFTKQLL